MDSRASMLFDSQRGGRTLVSLAAIRPHLIADYRDERLAAGKSAATVRLEMAVLSRLFTIAMKEWRLGRII
jgi:hypothetical protein